MNRVSAEEARGLLEGARQGPWIRTLPYCDHVDAHQHVAIVGGFREGHGVPVVDCVESEADADLIASAPDLAHTVVALEADLAALRIEHEAHAALLTLARRDRDEARAFLTSEGYRSCTSAACNCGGWHKATP